MLFLFLLKCNSWIHSEQTCLSAASEAKLWWTTQSVIDQKFQDNNHASGLWISILTSSLSVMWYLYYAFSLLWLCSADALLTYGSNHISNHMGTSDLLLVYYNAACMFFLPTFTAGVHYFTLHFLQLLIKLLSHLILLCLQNILYHFWEVWSFFSHHFWYINLSNRILTTHSPEVDTGVQQRESLNWIKLNQHFL